MYIDSDLPPQSNLTKVKELIKSYITQLEQYGKIKEENTKLKDFNPDAHSIRYNDSMTWEKAEKIRAHYDETADSDKAIVNAKEELNKLADQIGELLPLKDQSILIEVGLDDYHVKYSPKSEFPKLIIRTEQSRRNL